jgi:double-stranded uracil-DNA glycosylase
MKIFGLPPVVNEDSRILILGSMPGVASLEAQQYYGHPRNAFWPLLYSLLDGGAPSEAYEQRIRFALSHGVALWDVLSVCEREGSLDSAIREPEAGDFARLFERFPKMKWVFFNGKAASDLYRRHVLPLLSQSAGAPTYTVLPSTSPAHTMRFEAKLAAWEPVREAWQESHQ